MIRLVKRQAIVENKPQELSPAVLPVLDGLSDYAKTKRLQETAANLYSTVKLEQARVNQPVLDFLKGKK